MQRVVCCFICMATLLSCGGEDGGSVRIAWTGRGYVDEISAVVTNSVFVANFGDSSGEELTPKDWNCKDLVWSPDGARLFFIDGYTDSLWTVRPSGGGLTKLFRESAGNICCTAATSDHVYYVRESYGYGELKRVDYDGGNETTIADAPYQWLLVTEDKSRIVFPCEKTQDKQPTRICSVKLDGSDLQEAAATPAMVRGFKPGTNKLIAYGWTEQATGPTLNQFYLLPLDGSPPEMLIEDLGYDFSYHHHLPSFNADNSKFTFYMDKQIWIADEDGGNVTSLMDNYLKVDCLLFDPDNDERIIFGCADLREIDVVAVNGTCALPAAGGEPEYVSQILPCGQWRP